MRKVVSVLTLIIFFIFLVIISYPIVSFYLLRIIPSYIETFYEERDNVKLERMSKDDNYNILTQWIHNQLGDIVYEVVKIEYIGRKDGTDISTFDVSVPFADSVTIYVDSSEHSVINNNLSFTGTKKFKYLYSEWVKKQIGIEDENVKIEFYVKDETFIDFKQIESISDDCSEIFKNVYNCELNRIYIKNFPNLSLDNFVNYVKSFVNEKYSKLASLSSFTGGFIILAYGYDYDMYVSNSSEYDKYYGTKEDINNYLMGVFNGGKLDNEVTYYYVDEKKGTYYEDEIIIS